MAVVCGLGGDVACGDVPPQADNKNPGNTTRKQKTAYRFIAVRLRDYSLGGSRPPYWRTPYQIQNAKGRIRKKAIILRTFGMSMIERNLESDFWKHMPLVVRNRSMGFVL